MLVFVYVDGGVWTVKGCSGRLYDSTFRTELLDVGRGCRDECFRFALFRSSFEL